jgi:hypothetical protein
MKRRKFITLLVVGFPNRSSPDPDGDRVRAYCRGLSKRRPLSPLR